MTKVKLRSKPITQGKRSLYLDFYPPITDPQSGKTTRREFLDLSIFDKEVYQEVKVTNKSGKSQTNFLPVFDKNGDIKKIRLDEQQKLHNTEILKLADNIRLKRETEIANSQYGFIQKEKLKGDFIEYMRSIPQKRELANYKAWECVINHLIKFKSPVIKFSDINEGFCNSFREYMLTKASLVKGDHKISKNTAWAYFNIFLTGVRQAQREEIISLNIADKIEKVKKIDVKREFLTLEELQKLAITPCRYPVLKNAALFSALTGLRFSDINKLTWEEIRIDQNEGPTLHYRQKKTRELQVLPISDEALTLLGTQGKPEERVFKELANTPNNSLHLKRWFLEAGIMRDLTFHSFRHTFATLQLSKGTDIYTVSKMLGHRSLKTTEIYAKVIDKKKRDAANRISLT